MTKSNLMDKYPVYSLSISKTQTNFKNIDEIIEQLKSFIEAHPVAIYISTFDHYTHTKSLGEEGKILEGLKSAKNLIFCFGKQIPNTQILAVRPRTISVSELENSFSIDFLEVPNEQLQVLVEKWVKSLTSTNA